MPGCIVSATTANFSSVEKRRLRATPVITSTFENVSDIGTCLGLFLGPLGYRPCPVKTGCTPSSKPTSSRTVSGVGDRPREWPDAATVDSAYAADSLGFIGSTDAVVIIAPAKAKTQTCLRVELPLPAIMPV